MPAADVARRRADRRHLRIFKKVDTEYGNAIKAAGGSVDWINLPDVGIKGNGHMLMQDKNNAAIADVIQKWLVSKGLTD